MRPSRGLLLIAILCALAVLLAATAAYAATGPSAAAGRSMPLGLPGRSALWVVISPCTSLRPGTITVYYQSAPPPDRSDTSGYDHNPTTYARFNQELARTIPLLLTLPTAPRC